MNFTFVFQPRCFFFNKYEMRLWDWELPASSYLEPLSVTMRFSTLALTQARKGSQKCYLWFYSVLYKNNWSYRLCCSFVLFWINVLLKLSNIFGSLFLLALEPKWETSFSRSMVLSMIMPAISSPAISFHIYWKKSIWAGIQKSLYISPTVSYLCHIDATEQQRALVSN